MTVWRLCLAGLWLALAGCAQRVVLVGPIAQPATLPIRAFPNIWLLPGPLTAERDLARQLAKHLLSHKTSRVAIVSHEALERRRISGRIPPATVLLGIRVDLEEQFHLQWGSHPETVCDSIGCYMTRRSRVRDTPVLKATLHLEATDPLTERPLQTAQVKAVEQGERFEAMRRFVVNELAVRAKLLTDQRLRFLEVELLEVAAAPMDRVVELAEQERFASAARVLRRYLDSPAGRGLPGVRRGRLWYNLALLLRLKREGVDRRSLSSARKAFDRAASLDPELDVRRQLRELSVQRKRAALGRQQRADAVHNFSHAVPAGARSPGTP